MSSCSTAIRWEDWRRLACAYLAQRCLAPPVAAAPLAAPGFASRLPPWRDFSDKLAKVSP